MHTCFTLHIVVNLSTNKIEEANLQNELARIKVDSLNTEAHNVQLKDTLEQLETELTARDNLIAKYQLEIRQRTDEIEKKMYRVDR
jgi:coiled-coil domain-containing protein 40